MSKRRDDRMDPLAMDFDDEDKEMTDNDGFTTDVTPKYMFQKFELVLFLLADRMANLGPLSQLRLQDKLNISDGSVFCIQQELGPVGGNDKRLVLYKMFVGLLQDVGMLKMCEMLRNAYCSAYDYDRHYKKVVQNMHRYMGLSDKRDADWMVSLMLGQRKALPPDVYRKCKFLKKRRKGTCLNLNHTLMVKKRKVKSQGYLMVIPRGLYRIVVAPWHLHVN